MNQLLLINAITIFFLFSLILLIIFLYERQQHKTAFKQKAKEDREKKEQYDFILNEYPTISRYTTDGCFSDSEIIGTTGPVLPMEI